MLNEQTSDDFLLEALQLSHSWLLAARVPDTGISALSRLQDHFGSSARDTAYVSHTEEDYCQVSRHRRQVLAEDFPGALTRDLPI